MTTVLAHAPVARFTGQYCDTVVSAWLNQSGSANWTTAQNCSDCELGVQKLQLGSPFGYDDDGAATFASVTSSCNAPGYTYAAPTAYALNATAVPDPPPRICTSSYTVQDGDTCVSISVGRNVSTSGLISANGFDISCNLLPPTGSTICLLKTCNTYQLNMYDKCDDLTAYAHITRQQLLSWNPMINDFCNNLASWYGWNLCLSSTEGVVNPGQSGAIDKDAPVPSNAQSQFNKHCGQGYEPQKDEECGTISLAHSLSLNDFYFLNPQVNGNCSNLWRDTSYCVPPVGNILTYSGYTTPTPGTVFPKPTPAPTSSHPPIVTDPLSAKAPDTLDGCELYLNAFSESLSTKYGLDLNKINSCDSWARQAGVAVEDLLAWNPSLSSANCVLQAGKSYCILRSSTATSSSGTIPTSTTPTSTKPTSMTDTFTTPTSPTTTSGGVPPPAQTQTGANPLCKKWYIVATDDGCWGIANQAGILLEDFYKWNPGVGQCTSLWPNYAVCVGV